MVAAKVGGGPHLYTLRALAEALVTRHESVAGAASPPPSGPPITNEAFLGLGPGAITVDTVIAALSDRTGYATGEGLARWAGVYAGAWWTDHGTRHGDPAYWFDALSFPGPFAPVTAHYQPVTFLQGEDPSRAGTYLHKRTGWNVSNSSFPYIWGWDPKEGGKSNAKLARRGSVGTHLGFTFEVKSASGIIWINPQEAFLEVVVPGIGGAPAKRTSASLWGFGQWFLRTIPSRTTAVSL